MNSTIPKKLFAHEQIDATIKLEFKYKGVYMFERVKNFFPFGSKKDKEKTEKVKLKKVLDQRVLTGFGVMFAAIGGFVLVSSLAATSLQVDSSLPVPQNVKAFGDDRYITVYWDPVNNSRVVGYYVTYRPAGSNEEFKVKQTSHKGNPEYVSSFSQAVQLQPLTNGREYEIFVQSVSGTNVVSDSGPLVYTGNRSTWQVADGRVSQKTAVVRATPSSARVDAMRSRLTGFFDDFNLPAGPMDELKWNNGTSGCARPGTASAFINDQFHAHNSVGSAAPNATFCDRAGIASRPRTLFDITNISESNPGVIEFDIDGTTHGRDTWYLDVIGANARPDNQPIDITSHNTIEDNDTENPGNMIRINASGNGLKITYYDQNQSPRLLDLFREQTSCGVFFQGPTVVPYAFCDMTKKVSGLSPIAQPAMSPHGRANVRRNWVIQFTPSKIRIYIDSTLIAVADMPSGLYQSKKLQLHSTVFSYNTGKIDGGNTDGNPIPSLGMIHWDNFGFNGPKSDEVIYNYVEGGSTGVNPVMALGDADGYKIPAGNRTTIVKIPDQIGNLVDNKARLFYTLVGFDNSDANWTQGDHILLNGRRYDIPNPATQMSRVSTPLATATRPTSFNLVVEKSDLRTGDNIVQFRLADSDSSTINVHIELPYRSSDTARPTYTQPVNVYGMNYYDIIQPPMTNCDQYRYVEQDLGLPYQTGKANLTTGGQCVMLPKGAHNHTGGTGPTNPPPTPNNVPTVTTSLTATSANAPASTTVNVTATDSDGSVTKIDILQGTTVVRTCNNATSCSFTATNLAAGSYTFSATATDNASATGTSGTVTFTSNTPPPTTPTRFNTLPVNAALPTGAECAGRVRKVAEIRPANTPQNNTRGIGVSYYYPRVDGNFVGTTDEIIQWAACKWGMDEDVLRAQMARESYWHQSAIGDFVGTTQASCSPVYPVKNYPAQYNGDTAHSNVCPESYGLSQVRWWWHKSAFYNSETEIDQNLTNNAIYSTAFNVDYWGAVWRTCYDGNTGWLNTVERGRDYAAGDVWGCLGVWFSGRWYTAPAQQYITDVQSNLSSRIWEQDYFRNSTPVNTIPPKGPVADTTPPTVSIIRPTSGQTVNGTVTIDATASDASGIARVEFFLNGASTPFFTDTTSPYSASWVSTTVPNGQYRLTARAYDTSTNQQTTGDTTVTVSNTVPDTTLPTVSQSAIRANQTVAGIVTINATATDNVGVTRVELLLNGVVRATDFAAPFSFDFNSAGFANGQYRLQLRAYDAVNASPGLSTEVRFQIFNPVVGPKAGDVNADGLVDINDIVAVLNNWNRSNATRAQGDLNADGRVNVFDLSIIVANWGK